MYDAVAEAVPMAHARRNRKKAIVIISDGNDTSSRVGVGEVRQVVRESEVLVYAVGIDGEGVPTIMSRPRPPVGGGPRFPIPVPDPGRRRPRWERRRVSVPGRRRWRRLPARRCRRSRQRRGAAADYRRQRRPHRDRRRSARPGSRDRDNCRRAEQAVLHRLSEPRVTRTGAGTASASKSKTPPCASGPAAATSRRPDASVGVHWRLGRLAIDDLLMIGGFRDCGIRLRIASSGL